MANGLKMQIIELRNKGRSYKEIADALNCSKGIISYHCKNYGVEDIGLGELRFDRKLIESLNHYYLQHTKKETAKKFNISQSTVLKYVRKKREILTPEDRALRNYQRVKMSRIRIKEKAVAYKGGKCERCEYNKCIWALSFHHKDTAKKEFSLSQYKAMNWTVIKRELDKCELVCENCHREIHYQLEVIAAKTREYKLYKNKKRIAKRSERVQKEIYVLICPSCEKEFTRDKRSCHIGKKGRYTCCSRSCRSKFSRYIQLNGETKEVKLAIYNNLKYDRLVQRDRT